MVRVFTSSNAPTEPGHLQNDARHFVRRVNVMNAETEPSFVDPRTSRNRAKTAYAALVGMTLLGACGTDPAGRDGGSDDSSALDARAIDDAGRTAPDARPPDAGTAADAGSTDAGESMRDDAGLMDASPDDAGPVDASLDDAGPVDASPDDAGPVDASPSDAGSPDAGGMTPDAGVMDAGRAVPDAAVLDAAIPNVCAIPTAPVPVGVYGVTAQEEYCFAFSPECTPSCRDTKLSRPADRASDGSVRAGAVLRGLGPCCPRGTKVAAG